MTAARFSEATLPDHATVMHVVTLDHHEAIVAEKDACIDELKNLLASRIRVAGSCYIVDKDEYDSMKARIAEMERTAADDGSAKRVQDLGLKYGDGEIDGFDPRTPEQLAEYVEGVLASGGKTTFAAACCVLLQRKLEQARRTNAVADELSRAATAI